MEMSRTTNINVPFSRMLGNTPYTTTIAPAMSLQTSTPTRYSFSFNELYYILYLQQEVEIIKVEDITPQLPQSSSEKKTLPKTKDSLATCEQCRGQPQAECIEHGPLLFPRKTGKSSGLKDIKLSYAISSFPDEVQLCCSSIPASGYGVSAKQDIPIGTWIGPYEGKRIRPEDVTNEMDTSYMWEIFQDGKLVCYLDASDENTSSWMRFIRCARHRDEQNLYAFQYCGNIYYRAYRNISVGQELLVWYDDKYQQHMGLPLNIQDMAVVDPNGNNLLFDLSACNVSGYPQKSTPVTPVVKSTHVTITQHTPVHVSPQVSVDFSGQHCIPLRTLEQRPVNIVHRVASVSPCTTLAVTQSTLKVPQHSSSNALHLKPASYPHKYPIAPIKICPTKTVMQNSLAVTPRIHNSVTQPVTKPTLEGRPLPSPNTKYLSHEQHPPSKKIRLTYSVDTSHDHHVDADKVPQHYVSKYSQHQETVISQCENITLREYDVEETNGTDVQMDHTEDAEMCLWRCGQCQQSFTQRSLLQIHVCPRMPNRPYKCGHCADSFSRSSELRTHVVRHTNEKPFKCGYCSRSFAGSTTLNNHIRTHTGEKPFVCGKCKRMFSTASQLSRHQRIPAECV